MSEVYDLSKMLEEIIEDEKVSTSGNRKVSQNEIKTMLLERQRTAGRVDDCTQIPVGKALIQEGLISQEQLDAALHLQASKGGKIGSLLIEMGFISDDDFLRVLSKKTDTQGVNLLESDVSEDLLNLLPFRIMEKYRVIPYDVDGRTLSLAMENPGNKAAMHEVEFLTGKTVHPLIASSYQMDLALQHMQERGGKCFSGLEIQQGLRAPMTILTLLEHLAQSEGSDLLITVGAPPTLKILGQLVRADMPCVTSAQCVAYAKALMNDDQWDKFLAEKSFHFASEYKQAGRFRVSAYTQRGSISLAIRRIPESLPSAEVLGLPSSLVQLVRRPQGLILITGPAGHGKSTTLRALLSTVNESRGCNIITLEDPIEHVYRSDKSNINQRELGSDAISFSGGLTEICRHAPDIVVLGEIRGEEEFEMALDAAAGGHLVLSTLMAANATSALENMVNRCPLHRQGLIQQQLADLLLVVFSQRLLPGKDGRSLVLAHEKLVSSNRVRNYIRENKLAQIRAQVPTESEDFASFDVSLGRLVREDKIALETALALAEAPESLHEGRRRG